MSFLMTLPTTLILKMERAYYRRLRLGEQISYSVSAQYLKTRPFPSSTIPGLALLAGLPRQLRESLEAYTQPDSKSHDPKRSQK
jgi:hypothetical protein